MGRSSRTSKTTQLVTHPAFPLIVALWFAALIGLGSLLVPSSLVERVVVAIGLPDLISAAAPPLGMTAKIAIAVLGAVVGAVLGLLLGRQVYRASRDVTQVVTPINAHEELGANGLDGDLPELEEGEETFETFEQDDTDFGGTAPEEELEETAYQDDEAWDLAWLDNEEQDGAPFVADLASDPAASEIEPEPEPEITEFADTPDTFEVEAREDEFVDEDVADEPADLPDVPLTFASPSAAAPEFTPNVFKADKSELDDLSLMQLAQRLQGAISAHRAMRAVRPAAVDEPVAEIPADKADDLAEFEEAAAPEVVEEVDNANPTDALEIAPKREVEPVEEELDETKETDLAPEPHAKAEPAPEPYSPPEVIHNPKAKTIHHPAHKPFIEADELMADDDNDVLDDESALGETYSSLLAMTASVRAEPEEPREEEIEDTLDTQAQDNVPASETAMRETPAASTDASTLAALDRAPKSDAKAQQVDPQEQALRDALMNLHQFSRTS